MRSSVLILNFALQILVLSPQKSHATHSLLSEAIVGGSKNASRTSLKVNRIQPTESFRKVSMSQNLPLTKRLYLNDTYQSKAEARVLTRGHDEKKGDFVVLDQTIFYPQGGGQPADTGRLIIKDQEYPVHSVSSHGDIVYHYIQGDVNLISDQDTALLHIDFDKRLLNAKLHTSGHLLCDVIEGLAPELKAFKGFHFPEGPSVEFEGQLTSLSTADLIEQASRKVEELIASKRDVQISYVGLEEFSQLRETTYQLAEGQKARVMSISGFKADACGGTHIQSLSELQSVVIKKIKPSRGNLKVSYSVQ